MVGDEEYISEESSGRVVRMLRLVVMKRVRMGMERVMGFMKLVKRAMIRVLMVGD